MKKKLLFSIVIILLLIVSIIIPKHKQQYIDKVLSQDAYSYLNQNAKDYVKSVYENTGEVLLTEQNKEENVPYLNPQYVDYLNLSEEEQDEVEIIPNVYAVDYDYTNLDSTSMPSSFDLRNINGASYITPLKNQGSLGICWAFTGVEQAESYLMLKENNPYNSSSKVFSTRQIDYALSNDGIKDYNNEFGYRNISAGGNFSMFSEIASYGLSLIDESNMPFTSYSPKKELSTVFDFKKSNYEVNNTVELPGIAQSLQVSSSTESELINSYINTIKSGVKEYGGAFASVASPERNCSFKNTDGKYALALNDNCYESEYGHAMQIIGWDDNYKYTYCKGNSSNSNVTNNTCSSGVKKVGTGAFILRNSWGTDTDYQYVYLTYDSINSNNASPDVNFITDMTRTSERTWDNAYYNSLDYSSETIYFNSTISKEFTKDISGEEKLEKVKFTSLTADGTYSIIIKDGDKTYRYNNILETNLPGIYTIDLSNKNIITKEDTFKITITSNGAYSIDDSIAAFTSNVDDNPKIEVVDKNRIEVNEGSSINKRLYSKTRNIDSENMINYSLYKESGENYSSYLSYNNNIVSKNDINTNISITNLPKGRYVLKQSYGNYTNEVPIKIKGTNMLQVTYYANNGTNNSVSGTVQEDTAFNLYAIQFTKSGYKFAYWSTNSDGSGTHYNNKELLDEGITENLVLYAQWEPVNYHLAFFSNGGAGTMSTQNLQYGVAANINVNQFTKKGHIFVGWNTNANGSGQSYQDNQLVINLTNENERVISLYAQWQPIKYYIKYDSNGGTGSMYNQEVTYDSYGYLTNNNYSKTGYAFIGWNTKADGSGTSYYNMQAIKNLTEVNNDIITLYAQWSPINYIVRYNSNGGVGTMPDQTMTYDVSTNLNSVQFTKENADFIGWNTYQNGSGTSYTNEQSVKNLTYQNNRIITLYAQWHQEEVEATSIYLNKTKTSLEVGKEEMLGVYIYPNNSTSTITWESLNNKVVTVNDGKIKAISQGQAYVVARTSNNLEARCLVTVTSKPFTFTDVKPSDWFYESVKYTYEHNIIKGYNDYKFGPNDKVTRGQLVTILWRMEGQPTSTRGVSSFVDVGNDYYTEAIRWANQNDIVHGYTSTTFGPNNPIVRQDLAVILKNYANYKNDVNNNIVSTNLETFADYYKIKNTYSESAIQWAVENSIMSGKNINNKKYLSPNDHTTRAETAAMITNYTKRFNKES